MVGEDSVEHHSKLLRRAAAKALLGEPFEEERRMCWLGLAKAGLQIRLAAMAYNLRWSWRLLTPKSA